MENTSKNILIDLKNKINLKLDEFIPQKYPDILYEAMRYSVLGEGKRLRAALCLESCRTFGGNEEIAIPTACAIEIVHAQSLIHDDLPCMDNDDYRRGKLSAHKQFGEAIAVLTGDALIPMAYEVLTKHTPNSVPPETKLRVLEEFSKTIGGEGLVGGQIIDVINEGKKVDSKTLEYIHLNKTGALFRFSLRSGAILAKCSETNLKLITEFATLFGLAFQISDDVLDVIGTKEKIGKTPGKDKATGKNTYPSLFGLEASIKEVNKLCDSAKSLLNDNKIESQLFFEITNIIAERIK